MTDTDTANPAPPPETAPLFDPDEPWVLDAETLHSRSKNTPFDGARLSGRVLRTLVAGRTVYAYSAAPDQAAAARRPA